MSRAPELRALTGARGIAAWFVVAYHLRRGLSGLPEAMLAVFAKGYLAVDFFFLLSGFVIWLTWGERLHRERRAAIVPFLVKRIARVWPLHLVMLAAAAALALLLAATGHPQAEQFPPAELPFHLLLIQMWGLTDRLAWNDPAWSISAEFAAYLLTPLLALSVDWRRVPSATLLAILAALFVALHLVMSGLGAATLGTDIPRFGVLRCVIEFGAGTILWALWLRWRAAPWRGWAALLLAGVGLAAWIGGLVPETLAVPASFGALLFALATLERPANPLGRGAIHYLGEISYATYLSHFLLYIVFKLAMVDDATALPAVLVGLYLAIVLASSIALYHLVERPAQRWVEAQARRRLSPHFTSSLRA